MFILDTDASGKTIGCVLSQVQDGKEEVIAYGSRALSRTGTQLLCDRQRVAGSTVFYRILPTVFTRKEVPGAD